MNELSRSILRHGEVNLSGDQGVRSACEWIHNNPDSFTEKVITLNEVQKYMNKVTLHPRNYPQFTFQFLNPLRDVMPNFEEVRGYLDPESEEYDDVMEGYIYNGFQSLRSTPQEKLELTPELQASKLLLQGGEALISAYYDEDDYPTAITTYRRGVAQVLANRYYNFPLMQDYIAIKKNELKNRPPAVVLNELFKDNISAYAVTDILRELPFPIAVDIHNTITDSYQEHLHPDAQKFIDGLREVGDVVYVTMGDRWDIIQNNLKIHGLWDENSVLITANNIDSQDIFHDTREDVIETRNEYIEFMKSIGRKFDYHVFDSAVASKTIAPIFLRPWDVPIIDDNPSAASNNPGMFGVKAEFWEPSENTHIDKNAFTLLEALKRIQAYSRSIRAEPS